MTCRGCKGFLASILKFLNYLQTFVGVAIILYSLWMFSHWNHHDHVPPTSAPSPESAYSSMLNLFGSEPKNRKLVENSEHILFDKLAGLMSSHLESGSSSSFKKLPPPWFIYSSMSTGITWCLINFIGYIAAETINDSSKSGKGVQKERELGETAKSILVKVFKHAKSSAVSLLMQTCWYSLLATILILVEAVFLVYILLNKHWEKVLPHDPTGEFDHLRSFIQENIEVCEMVGMVVIIIQVLSLLLAIILRAMVTRRADYNSENEDGYLGVNHRQPLMIPQGEQSSASASEDSKSNRPHAWSLRMREKYGLNPHEFGQSAVDPKAFQAMRSSDSDEDRRKCSIM